MAHSYPDSTFFVESDDQLYPRMTPRQAAKMVARQRQELISNELSRLAAEEYLEEIMDHMRHMEVSFQGPCESVACDRLAKTDGVCV